MPIQEVKEVFSFVNFGKFTEWRVKPDYFSISVYTSSLCVIIIGFTCLDESVDPSNATSTNGDALSFRDGIHRVYVLQSTLENTIFEGFIIYSFVHLKFFLNEDSLFILLFTALGICFTIDLG